VVELLHGDCLQVMKNIPDKSVDLTVTSPPYDNLRTYNNTLEWGEHVWKPVISELFRITKDGGVVVWVVGDATIKGSETGTSFKQALYFKEVGFNLHDTMIYLKDNCPFPSRNRYYNNFEYMFVLCKDELKTFNKISDRENKSFGRKISGTNRQKNGETKKIKNCGNEIKQFGVRFNSWLISDGKRQSFHPAVFPEQLANDHIISWSNENDVIFDPFMGSGTTGKMAILNGRDFIGIEKDEEYFKMAKNRIEQAQQDVAPKV
jgi:DNA modification methylase